MDLHLILLHLNLLHSQDFLEQNYLQHLHHLHLLRLHKLLVLLDKDFHLPYFLVKDLTVVCFLNLL
jgi:hypothetical protein